MESIDTAPDVTQVSFKVFRRPFTYFIEVLVHAGLVVGYIFFGVIVLLSFRHVFRMVEFHLRNQIPIAPLLQHMLEVESALYLGCLILLATRVLDHGGATIFCLRKIADGSPVFSVDADSISLNSNFERYSVNWRDVSDLRIVKHFAARTLLVFTPRQVVLASDNRLVIKIWTLRNQVLFRAPISIPGFSRFTCFPSVSLDEICHFGLAQIERIRATPSETPIEVTSTTDRSVWPPAPLE